MTTSRIFAVQVTDLLDRPGASRQVHVDLPPPGDLRLELGETVAPLRLDAVLESVVDGLLLRGRLTTTVATPCARCLGDLTERVATDVVELFVDPADATSGEEIEPGYEIADGVIDLDTLLRDALVPAVPFRALCRPDCQGLCASCGANRNEGGCDCTQTTTDERWAALEGLRLPESTTTEQE
ncbi:MAG: DUF177 domain-containing protein [Euzebyales bacterium]|nr:DUF177 domain-containing protein [Euzebyales bacterium]